MSLVLINIPAFTVANVEAWARSLRDNPMFDFSTFMVNLCAITFIAAITFFIGPEDDILAGEAGLAV